MVVELILQPAGVSVMAKQRKAARRAKKRSPRWPKDNAINCLPFVGPFPHGDPEASTFPRCFWANANSTGDKLKDQRLGDELALLTLRAMAADPFPPLLFWILKDMARQRCPEQIKTGIIPSCRVLCDARSTRQCVTTSSPWKLPGNLCRRLSWCSSSVPMRG